jgi:lipoprotein-anchoring transpeptidase ErfK/SrfK
LLTAAVSFRPSGSPWGGLRGFSPAGFYPFAYPESASAYGPILDHGHEIPALDPSKIDPALLRQLTASPGPYRPGMIVVNVGERRLYLVRPGGAAIRYAVGVGREEALNFRGSAWNPVAAGLASLCPSRSKGRSLP